MKSITEIRDWLLENAVDECGDLDISELDFSEFDGDVLIIGMEVKGNVIISGMKVQGDLYQSGHKIEGDYTCENIKVKGGIYTNEPTKLLKKITREELAEMGYEIEGGDFVSTENKNIDVPKMRGYQPKKADKPANKPKK